MKKLVLLLVWLSIAGLAEAQSFSSGSTGADGALDLTNSPACPQIGSGPCILNLPESGILNYTTVNIPSNRWLIFKRNSRNTPVYLLAQGAVNIAGVLDVNAGNFGFSSGCTSSGCEARVPGPGGFYGGATGQLGYGPGAGGFPPDEVNGKWVGPLALVPIVGGSGASGYGSPGGGGGGAIVVASSTSITVTGQITANGTFAFAGIGSGGAIRLVSNSISVSGLLRATVPCCQTGNSGVVRLEAPSGAIAFTGNSSPPAGLFPINPAVAPDAAPSLTILSVGGYSVPSYAGQRFDTYDMLLPNQLSDPISVVVHGANIPPGTTVNVGIVNGSPSATSTPGTLSGTFESSTASATVSNLTRTAVTYLLATAQFDPPAAAMKFNPSGKNHVAKIRVLAAPGQPAKFVLLRRDGSEIDRAKMPKRFLQQLGL